MIRGVKSNSLMIALPVVITVMVVAGIVAMRRMASVDSIWVPKCTIHQLTGLHCPGCGTTRALHAIANGRISEAIRFNPLLVLGLPLILAIIFVQRFREHRGRRAMPGLAWTVLGILCVYTLARNLPSPERSWLAPPAVGSKAIDRTDPPIETDRPVETED